jgi:hypothetical protein
MKTKGVAISQIILLVLGIIVLSVVAFLLYSNFTTTTGQIDVQKCRAVATNACTACSIATGGLLSGCTASTYLLSDSDKACGQAIANDAGGLVGAIDPTTKKVVLSGNINCKQYVGGGGLTATGSDTSCKAPSIGTDQFGKETRTCAAGTTLNGAGTCCI